MGMYVGRGRKARRCYGFDEIALVPGNTTINPNDVDISWVLNGKKYEVPIIAAAMDGVVNTNFAKAMGSLGGMAVLNLEGIHTRYRDPSEIYEKIANSNNESTTQLLQDIYQKEIEEDLISIRIEEMLKTGGPVAVSSIPRKADRYGDIAQEAGADVFIVQSTVTTPHHKSSEYKPLDFEKFCKKMNMSIIVGNSVTYKTALALMETGIDALLVGIGPGAACTTRGVLGIGVPQVTATADSAAARDRFFVITEKYVPIITDGGMSTGGDICKAIACGADAVMVGSAFAKAEEAPGRGLCT